MQYKFYMFYYYSYKFLNYATYTFFIMLLRDIYIYKERDYIYTISLLKESIIYHL